MTKEALLQKIQKELTKKNIKWHRTPWQNFTGSEKNHDAFIIEPKNAEEVQEIMRIVGKINDQCKDLDETLKVRAAAGYHGKKPGFFAQLTKTATQIVAHSDSTEIPEEYKNESYSLNGCAYGDINLIFNKDFIPPSGKRMGMPPTDGSTEVTMAAGVTVAEGTDAAAKRGLMASATPMISFVTWVGLLLNSGHGTGFKEGSIAGLVSEVTLCDDCGNIRIISPGKMQIKYYGTDKFIEYTFNDNTQFEQFIGANLGLFGIVLEVKMKFVPETNIRETLTSYSSVGEFKDDLQNILTTTQYVTISGMPPLDEKYDLNLLHVADEKLTPHPSPTLLHYLNTYNKHPILITNNKGDIGIYGNSNGWKFTLLDKEKFKTIKFPSTENDVETRKKNAIADEVYTEIAKKDGHSEGRPWEIRQWEQTDEPLTGAEKASLPIYEAGSVEGTIQEIQITGIPLIKGASGEILEEEQRIARALKISQNRKAVTKVRKAEKAFHYQQRYPRDLTVISVLIPIKENEIGDMTAKILEYAEKNSKDKDLFDIYVRFFAGTNGGLSTSQTKEGEKIVAFEMVGLVGSEKLMGFKDLMLAFITSLNLEYVYHHGKYSPDIPYEDFPLFKERVPLFKEELVKWDQFSHQPGTPPPPFSVERKPLINNFYKKRLGPFDGPNLKNIDTSLFRNNFSLVKPKQKSLTAQFS